MENQLFIVDEGCDGLRVDKYLSLLMEDRSRSFIQKLIQNEAVTVDLRPVKASYKIGAGEEVRIAIPEPIELHIEAEDIPLDIVYEDHDLLIVNKPKDMVVHPAPGHYGGTLVNAVMYHCRDSLSSINGVLRPGIVHRIDKDTTGLLVICKNDETHRQLAEQFAVHNITRTYHAIVYNNFKEDEGTVDAPIARSENDRKKMAMNVRNGRRAVTHYKVLERFGKYTYIACQLETGRTHQIRVHMSGIGHPLLGDTVYGPEKDPFRLQGQALHAKTLGFIHPGTGQYVEFDSQLPEYFTQLLTRLRSTCGGN